MKVQVAPAGHANAFDSLERQKTRQKLFGDSAGWLTKLLGQLETGGDGEIAHFRPGRNFEDRLFDLQAENFVNDLGEFFPNFLLNFEVQEL